jgi:hypothetical protein
MQPDSMVVHQCRLGEAGLRDCALVVCVVLAALNSQARHLAILELFNERGDASVPDSEFAHAMLSMANHADNPHGHRDEQVQKLTAGVVTFLMEVDPFPLGHKVARRTTTVARCFASISTQAMRYRWPRRWISEVRSKMVKV